MLEQCVAYREQLIMVAGVIIILAQMVMNYIERCHFRNIINQHLPPPPEADYEHRN